MGKFVAPYLKNIVVRHTSPFSGTGSGKVKLPPFGFFLQRSIHHATRAGPAFAIVGASLAFLFKKDEEIKLHHRY